MTQINPQPKHKRIKLSNKKLRKLYDKVKERDNHRCIISGVHTDDDPHHIVYRSQGGSDVAENLATLDWDYAHYYIHHGNDNGLNHVIDMIERRYGDKALLGLGGTVKDIVKEYGRLKYTQMFLLNVVKN